MYQNILFMCRAQWVLKKIIRSSIPEPKAHLETFRSMPDHFRTSELANLANRAIDNKFTRISNFLKPTIDANGITFANVQIDPSKNDALRILHENDENFRVFKIVDLSGVSLPAPNLLPRILDRRVRACLFNANTDEPLSNVFTIPSGWREKEKDQWIFGSKIWKETVSSTVNEWNVFVLRIEGAGSNIPPHSDPMSPRNRNGNEMCTTNEQAKNTASNDSDVTPNIRYVLRFELCILLRNDETNSEQKQQDDLPNSSTVISKQTEMSCGWCEIDLTPNAKFPIDKTHKLRIFGGSFIASENISSAHVTNDHSSNLSFRKLSQMFKGTVESFMLLQETSFSNIKNNRMVHFMSWMPSHILVPFSSIRLFKLYYELVCDHWLRNRRSEDMFRFPYRQHLFESIFLFIINQPNLFCSLIDTWNELRDTWSRQQRRDNEFGKTNNFIKNNFQELLTKFLPLMMHRTIVENPLQSLDKARIVKC